MLSSFSFPKPPRFQSSTSVSSKPDLQDSINVNTANQQTPPKLDIANILEQLKTAGGGTLTIGSGDNELTITVNR